MWEKKPNFNSEVIFIQLDLSHKSRNGANIWLETFSSHKTSVLKQNKVNVPAGASDKCTQQLMQRENHFGSYSVLHLFG